MEDEYPRFTRNDWLDGIIWGCAAKETKRSAKLILNDVPFPIIERIYGELEQLGFEVDFIETPNAITRQEDLRLIAACIDPIFSDLPRYTMRRVLVTHPSEFIDGYILVRISPFRKRQRGASSTEFDITNLTLRVRLGNDRDAISEILNNRAIEYECLHRMFEIDPGCYDKHPFDTYLEGLTSEFQNFAGDVGDDESLLEQMEERIRERSRIHKEKRAPDTITVPGPVKLPHNEPMSMASEEQDSRTFSEQKNPLNGVQIVMCLYCRTRPVNNGRFCTPECAGAYLESEELKKRNDSAAISISVSENSTVIGARDNIALRDRLPGSAIMHLARKAKMNNMLAGYERAALYNIGKRKRENIDVSVKQDGFLEGLLWKAVHLGLVSIPCDVNGCEWCACMQKILREHLPN